MMYRRLNAISVAPRGISTQRMWQAVIGSLLFFCACWAAVPVHAGTAPLPTTGDAMLSEIRTALEARNYERLAELIYWEGAGKIKKRVVRYRVRGTMGRQIKSISLSDYKKDQLDDKESINGRLRLNMPVTHKIRIVYDEPNSEVTGTTPTTVFLIGPKKDAMRIALVVRNYKDDDGD